MFGLVVALSAGLVPGTTSNSPAMDLDEFDIELAIRLALDAY
jgi:hypothetical protein